MQIIGLPAERKLQENEHFSQLIIESASRVCLPPASSSWPPSGQFFLNCPYLISDQYWKFKFSEKHKLTDGVRYNLTDI